MKSSSHLLWVAWSLAACTIDNEPHGKPPGGSDTALDTAEAGDSGDSGTDTSEDTGTEAEPVDLVGRVVWPVGGEKDDVLAVSATRMGWRSDTVEFGNTIAGTTTLSDDTFVLSLPARPPSSDLSALSPTEHPDLSGAMYLLTAFVPSASGSLSFVEGRTIRGMGFHRLLVWLDPDSLGDSGWPGGWSLVDTGLEGSYNPPACLVGTTQPLIWRWADDYPFFYELGEDDLAIDLRGAPTPAPLHAAVEGDRGTRNRLAAVPAQVLTGEDTSLAPVFDVDMTGSAVDLTLTDAPSATHDLGDSDWRVTLAYVLQYTDNGDGRWTLAGDASGTTGHSACHDGRPVYARYSRDIDDWRGFRLLECQNGRVGWRFLVVNDAGTYSALTDEEAANLSISPSCAF